MTLFPLMMIKKEYAYVGQAKWRPTEDLEKHAQGSLMNLPTVLKAALDNLSDLVKSNGNH